MKKYDAVVIGAGHAGIESAFALARKGKNTLLVTISLNAIGFMPCNPNIGGTGKGHIVREIDALGGEMGIVADMATIQSRMLNLGNGAAVHSLRNQVDKDKYHLIMKQRLEKQENLTVLESEIVDIITKDNEVCGVKTALGDIYSTKGVVIASGVYLNSVIVIGDYVKEIGPSGYQRAEGLTDSLLKMGLPVKRFKTGTPMRILRSSANFAVMSEQKGDEETYPFSEITDFKIKNTELCYLTYTNEKTHKIIMDNIERSPLYNGVILSAGPRYCPSIETKIIKFKDKNRHQIFIEPEGENTEEMYVQGLSTSLPFDVQEEMIKSVVGLEKAKIMRYGYAIEYDCIDPRALLPTLAVKGIKGLYCAGQINGSSGYEEAAGQGLVAGVNLAFFLEKKEEIVFTRDLSYIGVMIDDLVTKGTDEPYRMMTSRAEYRLFLRQDNADLRLTEIGREIGLVSDERYEKFKNKLKDKEILLEKLKSHYSPLVCSYVFESKNEPLPRSGISGEEILRRSTLNSEDLLKIDTSYATENLFLLKQIETEIKYEGYLRKQQQAIKELKKMESHLLKEEFDYNKVEGLRIEARQKLHEIKPLSLGQASRICGVNPADIVVLMVHLQKNK